MNDPLFTHLYGSAPDDLNRAMVNDGIVALKRSTAISTPDLRGPFFQPGEYGVHLNGLTADQMQRVYEAISEPAAALATGPTITLPVAEYEAKLAEARAEGHREALWIKDFVDNDLAALTPAPAVPADAGLDALVEISDEIGNVGDDLCYIPDATKLNLHKRAFTIGKNLRQAAEAIAALSAREAAYIDTIARLTAERDAARDAIRNARKDALIEAAEYHQDWLIAASTKAPELADAGFWPDGALESQAAVHRESEKAIRAIATQGAET